MHTFKYYYPVEVPRISTVKQLKTMSWQSLVFYKCLRYLTFSNNTNGCYINLSSKALRKRYGKNYAKHIADLVKKDWVEANDKYSAGSFSKSYRLSTNSFCQNHKDYLVPVGKRTWDKLTKGKFDDRSDTGSAYLQLVKSRHDLLHIPSNPRSVEARVLKAKLERKTANVHFGENRRVYSTIIVSSKEARKHVEFGTLGRMVNVDVTGMAQQILNRGIDDPQWTRWIRNDFASCLAKTMNLTCSRDTCKKFLMRALSKSPKNGLVKDIRVQLEVEFPEIMRRVDELNRRSSVQMETQREEALLIAEFVQRYKYLTVIPAHDGVFCGEVDAVQVLDALQSFLKARGLVGVAKIKPDLPHLRPKTLFEILESIPDRPLQASEGA